MFGAAFLEAPFRPGTIVTGAHLDTSRGEIRMWLPDRRKSSLGMGMASNTAAVNVNAKEEVIRAGILSLYQVPNTPQVACTTFESGVHILRAQEVVKEDDPDAHGDYDLKRQRVAGRDAENVECEDDADDEPILKHAYSQEAPDDVGMSSYSFYPVLEIKGQMAPCTKTYVDSRASILAIPSYDGAVRLYSLPKWITESSSPETVDDPDYDPDGGTCFSEPSLEPSSVLMDDMQFRVYGEDGVRYEKHMPVCALTMNQSSDKMCTAGNDMLVKLWDLQRGTIVNRLEGHSGWIWNVKPLDPNFHVAMSTATDGTMRKWDLREGKSVAEVNISAHGPGKVYPVTGVALRGNGWHTAVGSLDKSVYVVDCRMNKKLYCIGKHDDRVCRAMMYEDTLMTTGWDHVVRLWEFN